MHAHHAVDRQPLPLPLLVVLDVDELRGRQQAVAQWREVVAEADEVAHHEQLVGLLLPLVGPAIHGVAALEHTGLQPGHTQVAAWAHLLLTTSYVLLTACASSRAAPRGTHASAACCAHTRGRWTGKGRRSGGRARTWSGLGLGFGLGLGLG